MKINKKTDKYLENTITVKNLYKSFKVYPDKSNTLKDKMLFRNRNKFIHHKVLNGIDVNVKKGEALGLIGQNGSGKSTLLKLMSKIIYPDKGEIEIKGRVSSLIELGAGFHPEMTGRENIYTNAAIFGLTKREIDARLDDIIAFAELGSFIDNPVRTYSSGMYMRLAFAVAINVDADVLLIDEILAVGDANFQAKCFQKLREIKNNGTTIVIVSHSLGQIEQICDRSIWLKDGDIALEGTPFEVHPKYLDFMSEKRLSSAEIEEKREKAKVDNKNTSEGRWGSQEAKITDAYLLNSAGNKTHTLESGSPFKIIIHYKNTKKIEKPNIGIGVFRGDGLHVYGTNTAIDNFFEIDLKEEGIIECVFDDNVLLENIYTVDLALQSVDAFDYDYYKEAIKFSVFTKNTEAGTARLNHKWTIK